VPFVIDKATGKRIFVPQEEIAGRLSDGSIEPIEGTEIGVEGAFGMRSVAPGDLEHATKEGLPVASEAAVEEQRLEERFGDSTGRALLEGGARGLSVGLSDAILPALGVSARGLRERRERNRGASITGEILGGVAPTFVTGGGGLAKALSYSPAGLAERAGVGAAKSLGGLKGTVARGVTEGGLFGLGDGVSQVALSEEPLDAEKAAAVLGSNALYGAGIGGGAGLLAGAAAKGLSRAKAVVDDFRARGSASANVSDDLANLDRKGLRAAKDAELAAIDQARVAERASVADEITALRQSSKEGKAWLATENKATRKVMLDAERRLDRMIDNPKGLAQSPERALDALQRQEQTLAKIVSDVDVKPLQGSDDVAAFLRSKAPDAVPGARATARQAAADLLERNRALQARIETLKATASSSRLSQIDDAIDTIGDRSKRGLSEQLLQGSVYSSAASLAAPLGPLAPIVGAKAAEAVSNLVFGRLAKAGAETSARVGNAIDTLLGVAQKASKAAPVAATKVLSGVAFGPSTPALRPMVPTKSKLVETFREREREILNQTIPDDTGKPRMRPEAREAVAERLAPVRLLSPILADRMETTAARRMEFLAERLPKRPDTSAMQFGPDRWRPSDMDMRKFARYVAAVEDPAGIVERLSEGTLTPEDAEALREVYPETFADLRGQIISRLPELRETLPYKRRLSLSILFGVPVDPAMEPRIVQSLQANFEDEPGTEGGTLPPQPQPQFGSVKAPEPTPAQERAS
jgi:hypothetical protein